MQFFRIFISDISGHFLQIILYVIFAFVAYYNWKRRHLYIAAWKLPGPILGWLPILGVAPLYFKSTEKTILKDLMKFGESYKTPYQYWLGTTLMITISKPEQMEIILKDQNALDKHLIYDFMKPILHEGLITSKGDKWKLHRKFILQTFNQKILNTFVPIFYQTGNKLVDDLNRFVGKGVFDVEDMIRRCSTELVSGTIMGSEMDFKNTNDYHDWLSRTLEIFFQRMMKVWLWPDFIFNISAMGKEVKELIEQINGYGRQVVAKRKRDYNQRKNNKIANDDYFSIAEKRKVFLDYLIELSEEGDTYFNDEDLLAETNTLLAAGSETSAVTECFTLLTLALHQDIQDKVAAELYDIYQGEERETTHEDLNRMELLERVIKETMRIFPTVPVIARELQENVGIGDIILPKGCEIAVAIALTHRDPEIWTNPEKFDPDRFLPENFAKLHPYSFLPFSGGPRNCIGLKFAMMNMKTVIAAVVRMFKITTDYKSISDVDVTAAITLKVSSGMRIALERRYVNK